MGTWVGSDPRRKIFEIHQGQAESTRWFISWLNAYVAWRTEVLREGPENARELRLRVAELQNAVVQFILLFGGRRAGKTWLGVVWCVLFAMAVPDSIVWLVAPSMPRAAELEEEILKALPSPFVKDRIKSSKKWVLWNGSTLQMMSGWDGDALRRGRCDLFLLNEGQEIDHAAYLNCRAALADKGGLGIIAANPPKLQIGEWVNKYVAKALAKLVAGVMYAMNARHNPHINWTDLESMRHEMSLDEYERDILGISKPLQDKAWHAFAEANVQRKGELAMTPAGLIVPAHVLGGQGVVGVPHKLEDITTAILKKHFGGRTFEVGVSIDFQSNPYIVALVRRFYKHPVTGVELDFTVGEFIVEHGDEDDLIDEMESANLSGATTVCVADASGDWQDIKREKGRGSFEHFKSRGWQFIYHPDRKSKRNPNRIDSVNVGNSRFCNTDGVLRSFIDPSCEQTIEAITLWEKKNGIPNSKSPWAHISDAWRYWLWWFYPKRYSAGIPGPEGPKERKESRREQLAAGGF
jgi:hypothetical protein